MLEEALDQNQIEHSNTDIQYATFWQRFAAVIIDGIIIGIPLQIVSSGIMFLIAGLGNSSDIMTLGASGFSSVLGIIAYWLYFALQESSPKQATVGKRALGLKVVNMKGERLSFAQASGRHFSKIISSMTLLIGYIMAAFTAKKQALHDIIAGTLVVKS